MKNWKTTLAGIGAIMATLGAAIAAFMHRDAQTAIMTIISGLPAGVGLLFAKDKNVTGGTIQQ